MSKFDLIYEKALLSLKEQEGRPTSTFYDNILNMVNVLSKHDYLNTKTEQEIKSKAADVFNQEDSVKIIDLTAKPGLPAIRLDLSQEDEDAESFSVSVIDVEDPTKQKEFKTNTHLETIFDDVLSEIKMRSIQGAKPEAAVDELPPTEGAEAQPGAGQSALPAV
jgi:hypothetical protein